MWMQDVTKMCSKHICGEYVEILMIIGTLKKRKSINGYIDNDLIEIMSMEKRFNELKNEMKKRGYNPTKEVVLDKGLLVYLNDEQINHKIDRENSKRILLERCSKCQELHIK